MKTILNSSLIALLACCGESCTRQTRSKMKMMLELSRQRRLELRNPDQELIPQFNRTGFILRPPQMLERLWCISKLEIQVRKIDQFDHRARELRVNAAKLEVNTFGFAPCFAAIWALFRHGIHHEFQGFVPIRLLARREQKFCFAILAASGLIHICEHRQPVPANLQPRFRLERPTRLETVIASPNQVARVFRAPTRFGMVGQTGLLEHGFNPPRSGAWPHRSCQPTTRTHLILEPRLSQLGTSTRSRSGCGFLLRLPLAHAHILSPASRVAVTLSRATAKSLARVQFDVLARAQCAAPLQKPVFVGAQGLAPSEARSIRAHLQTRLDFVVALSPCWSQPTVAVFSSVYFASLFSTPRPNLKAESRGPPFRVGN
jgi:hypothetical protein